jgi:glycosyltransferase involved in cell wall biosynthesis
MVAPTVSVVIPVYRARYLRAAIESVLAQTFRDYEIIVVDDGSPDRAEIEAWPDRLRLLKQANQGPSVARNTGVQAARGRFVAFLDADDTWEPTYLQEQVAAISREQGLDLVYGNWLTEGNPESARQALETSRLYGPVTCESLLRDACTIVLSAVVARRHTVIEAGLFDQRFRHAEDFDLWLRMLKNGARFVFQRRVLVNRRVHAGSLSYDIVHHGENALRVLEKFLSRGDLAAAERAAGAWRVQSLGAEIEIERAKRAVASRDFETASQALRAANAFYRSWKLAIVRVLLWLCPTVIAHAQDRERRRHSEPTPATAERP